MYIIVIPEEVIVEITLERIKKTGKQLCQSTLLILEQTITYLHHGCSSELQIFILVFQTKKNCGVFLFGMKTCGWKLSSWWLNLEQIWSADISPDSFWWSRYFSILDHFIINIGIRGEAKTPAFLLAITISI